MSGKYYRLSNIVLKYDSMEKVDLEKLFQKYDKITINLKKDGSVKINVFILKEKIII